MQRSLTLFLAAVLVGCETPNREAFVGECAEYPEGQFDYGQIGIGTCLSAPTDLFWAEIGGQSVLVVANANSFLDFETGSVLTVDAQALPVDGSRVLMHDIAAQGMAAAVETDSFAGGMAFVPDRDIAAVSVRYSEGAEDLQQEDALVFVDLSMPMSPGLASVGPDGASALTVGADPLAVSYDPGSGLAFVSNITSGSVSVVDMLADPIDTVDAVSRARFDGVEFEDIDGSGSSVIVADLDIVGVNDVARDQWVLRFSEGRYRLAVPSEEGVFHASSSGQENWALSPLGVELRAEDTLGAWEGLSDPQSWIGFGGLRMALSESGSGDIVAATNGGQGGLWGYEADPMLSGRADSWDSVLGGPMVFVAEGREWLFYDAASSEGDSGIGVAISEDGVSYVRANGGQPVVQSGVHMHASETVADPHVLYDSQADVYRMLYSAFDGEAWSIGHASSVDLVDWEVDSEPLLENAASPVWVYSNGGFQLWAVSWDGDEWGVVSSRSVGGWEFDSPLSIEGVLPQGFNDLLTPPGVGLEATLTESWSIEGANRGMAGSEFQAGQNHAQTSSGWSVFLSVGAYLGEDILDEHGANGFSASDWDGDFRTVYGTLTDADGVRRIGMVDLSDPTAASPATLLEGREGFFDAEGVSSPVVYQVEDEWRMLYAGEADGFRKIGLARSENGLTWVADPDPVLLPGETWDALSVQPGSLVETGDGWTLWYTGSNGSQDRIGRAVSTDGVVWVKEDDALVKEGSPGAFDDSSVADPWVLSGEDGIVHLWYSGNDGDRWSIGYAWSDDNGATWVPTIGPVSEESWPVLSGVQGSFDSAAARRPVVSIQDDGSLQMLYTGQDAAVDRVGLAVAQRADRWYRAPARATTGDRVVFETVPGDRGGKTSIPLSQTIDGFVTSGLGVTASLVDEARGFLYLSSAASAYVYVIDIRDDSSAGFSDNLFEIEAVLVASSIPGAIGFRAMTLGPDSSFLYAVNDSPESVMVFDLDRIQDDSVGEVHLQAVVGAIPMARGAEKDKGVDTLASVGPSNLLRVGDRLFVANFNANTVSVVDLGLGVHGAHTHELTGVGENPHAMALSPDGSMLAVASLVGRLEGGRVGSQIALIDTSSLEIVGWIAND